MKRIRISVLIDKGIANHLKAPHTFHDECEQACIVLRDIQKAIDKRLKRKEGDGK